MSTKKKGLLTTSGEWAKHLRKYGKRLFWKSERSKARQINNSTRRESDDRKADDQS